LFLGCTGGGHNTSGASSSDGLVIDVSRYLTSVEIIPEKKLIHMGGGCTWKEAEATAMKHGLMAVSGTYNEVSSSP
jgi:FAD/FMN-containing dehydrogenase